VLFALLAVAHGPCVADAATDGTATLMVKVQAAMPNRWVVADRRTNALPEGHYWGLEYTGIRGEEFVVQGVADVSVQWQNANGEWRSDVVGKEALRLYIMPGRYRESWRRFLLPKRPASAQLIYEDDERRVYAHPSMWISSQEKLDRIMKTAHAIRWPDSPTNTRALSWVSWRADISRALAEN
jgi:hypothetical protein